MNIEITRINQGIEESPLDYVKYVNMDYFYKLSCIVDEIEKTCHTRPVILLAGPSGSGKTTTAMMLEKMLDERGHETHTVSMDNYFCPLTEEEKELAALGKVDLESPVRVDKELLNQQISAIEKCEEIEIPKYNFKTSSREWSGKKIQRKKGELVIFEGIYANLELDGLRRCNSKHSFVAELEAGGEQSACVWVYNTCDRGGIRKAFNP